MYITDRLFSESEPTEVHYSVIMNEAEYELYSEFQKEFGIVQKGVEAVKKVVSPLAQKLKVGDMWRDTKTAVKKMVGSYARKNPNGIIANAANTFKSGDRLGAFTGAFREVAQKYKV